MDVKRDRWGRPLIKNGDEYQPYQRVSTVAKVLDSKEGLMSWKQRMVAIGLGKRPDLAARASATSLSDKTALNEIVAGAMSAAESDKAANVGTTLHLLTEQMDRGDLKEMPDGFRADLHAYATATAHLDMLEMERFVVNDDVMAAGTFDRIVRFGDEVLVADLKTGKWENKYPHGVMQQIAIYARGSFYDTETEQRMQSLEDYGVNPHLGLLIHLPAGQGVCDLYLLDLDFGYELALLAKKVQGMYKEKPMRRVTS